MRSRPTSGSLNVADPRPYRHRVRFLRLLRLGVFWMDQIQLDFATPEEIIELGVGRQLSQLRLIPDQSQIEFGRQASL